MTRFPVCESYSGAVTLFRMETQKKSQALPTFLPPSPPPPPMLVPSSLRVVLPRIRVYMACVWLMICHALLTLVGRYPSADSVPSKPSAANPPVAPCKPRSPMKSRPSVPRPKPTMSASSCIPTANVESSLSTAGSNAMAVVSRGETSQLAGASTRSVDVLAKPPKTNSHRRCSSMYGETVESHLYDCLIKAIRRQEPASVKNLLTSAKSQEALIDLLNRTDDQQGLTPLQHAVHQRQYEVTKLILESIPAPEAREKICCSPGATKNRYTPIHIASMKGDCDIMYLLLKHGACPNSLTKLCATPLHLAASKGHTAACQLLLEHGANVNAATKTESTALLSAVHHKSLEMVQLLVGYGANPKITAQVRIETHTSLHHVHPSSHTQHLSLD
eukprot:Blabericola_migrator_1__3719@NODE_2112_length_3253_cov_429_439109_g1337_i0_p1_GENE_NODE_2112_length_3253_cov_429_439109_g1337_i0NODE_2112_length_3253_cov_429_439109_g1337_i0_p1_ORF_typecomplete_len389_score44_49Ank_2/PF12796_7/4_3e12Ank_2/PF12796_7/4_4e16Ank_4/PF13637_6/0_062Ank_4/PF13637_6/6_6e14Ank_4/PF13637_6/1_8e15Ank_5/PF13857_6/0_013Ank_5/PF13857_6/2_1e05Ank_5/PF13857_6/6e11Ank_5/PF13857_6/2_6e08Ank/PF00023_30/99Ank/PF00023_30/2_7e06Ank/PF00023_30/9_8e11Ank/PF00023_30/0_0015Ank_3/PF13606_6